jgi:hypothetical protein
VDLEDFDARVAFELLVGLPVLVVAVHPLSQLLVLEACLGDDALLQ